jgi:hypothetical protein
MQLWPINCSTPICWTTAGPLVLWFGSDRGRHLSPRLRLRRIPRPSEVKSEGGKWECRREPGEVNGKWSEEFGLYAFDLPRTVNLRVVRWRTNGTRVMSSEKRVLNPSSQPTCMSERIVAKETDRPTIWKPKSVNRSTATPCRWGRSWIACSTSSPAASK